MRAAICLATGVGLSVGPAARAGTVRTPANGGGHQISAHTPIGQTFVAEDRRATVGLYISPSNTARNSDRSLLVQLFDGAGVGGTQLDSRTLVPDATFSGYLDVDYGGLVAFDVGRTYTVTLSSPSDYWISDSTLGDPYPAGMPVITGALRPNLNDKAFEVVPVAPEPTAIVGMAVTQSALSRRRRVAR